MKYLAVGFNLDYWPSRAILIPWSAYETELFINIRKLAQDLGDEVEGNPHGRILYMPIVWKGDYGSRRGKETTKYLRRKPSNEERDLINTIRYLADASYHLYDEGKPLYDWVDQAKIEYGGPSSPTYTIDNWVKNPDIQEFVIITEVPLNKPVTYSICFYLDPPASSDALVEYMKTQLKLNRIQLASNSEYGFATTDNESLHRDLNHKVIHVPDVGKIMFKYVTATQTDTE